MKAWGLKTSMSPIFSPVPMSLMGTPSSSLMVMTMPPRAVPSSLARMRPVTATALLNSRGLIDGVLAGGGVKDQKCFVGGAASQFALNDAVDLFQLFHQMGFVCAGGLPCR